jgi:Threonine aldolase
MANQIALRILTQPGDELLAEENAHVLINEQGGPAVFSGLVMRGLPGRHGTFAPEQVRAAVRDWSSGHMPRTRLVSDREHPQLLRRPHVVARADRRGRRRLRGSTT